MAALLAATAGLALASAARPATIVLAKPPAPPAPAPDDGLRGGGFLLESDTLVQDEANDIVTATGSVRARYEGRTLWADTVQYNRKTGLVIASGSVRILNPDGSAEFASHITLDRAMSEGVAEGFSARLQGDVKIAAAATRRAGADRTELDNVVYTPCAVCGAAHHGAPTWSIRARRVVEDKKRQTIYFEHAVVEVMGVGVIALPRLWTADPTAARKSGFLMPQATFSGPRGFSLETPYYQVLSPSQDITISPQISSNVNPFLQLDYRKRFYSGVTDIRVGYTYDKDFTSNGTKFGPDTSRSYILGSGRFDIDPAWQWGFTAERASDKLIFQKYSVPDVFTDRGLAGNDTDRGLYAADDQRLISQLYAVRQDQGSYLSVAAISVQGLRPTDLQSTIPTIAPLIEARWEPDLDILGGRLRFQGSAVALTRNESPDNPSLPGVDSRRATGQVDWQASYTFTNGLRLAPFLQGRVDLYNLNGLSAPYASQATLARGFEMAGVTVSYPLIRIDPGVTYVIEPLALVEVAPNVKQDGRIPNEDSVLFETDETNLFEPNRSPGYDLYQGGQSITLGGRATALLDDGRGASLTLGERFAARNDPSLPAYSGMQAALSDVIVAADVTPIKGVRGFARLRLDPDTFQVTRLEAGAGFTTSRASGYISYLQEEQSPTGGQIRSLDLHGEAFFTRHWGTSAYVIVEEGAWRRQDVGIVYRDDCTRVEILYRHDETYNGRFGPTTSVILRLSLATLGDTGYAR